MKTLFYKVELLILLIACSFITTAQNDNEKRKNCQVFKTLAGLVTVQTKKLNEKTEIVVKDNSNGISQNIIDKIFQPFLYNVQLH